MSGIVKKWTREGGREGKKGWIERWKEERQVEGKGGCYNERDGEEQERENEDG